MPAASAAQKLAATSARSVLARRINACTATVAASPVTSLSGRAAVNQYSGHVTANAVAAIDHAGDRSPGTV